MNPIYSEELKQHLTSALAAFVRQTGISLKDLKAVCAEMDAIEADEHNGEWKEVGPCLGDGYFEGKLGCAVPMSDQEAIAMAEKHRGRIHASEHEFENFWKGVRRNSIISANQENERRRAQETKDMREQAESIVKKSAEINEARCLQREEERRMCAQTEGGQA